MWYWRRGLKIENGAKTNRTKNRKVKRGKGRLWEQQKERRGNGFTGRKLGRDHMQRVERIRESEGKGSLEEEGRDPRKKAWKG